MRDVSFCCCTRCFTLAEPLNRQLWHRAPTPLVPIVGFDVGIKTVNDCASHEPPRGTLYGDPGGMMSRCPAASTEARAGRPTAAPPSNRHVSAADGTRTRTVGLPASAQPVARPHAETINQAPVGPELSSSEAAPFIKSTSMRLNRFACAPVQARRDIHTVLAPPPWHGQQSAPPCAAALLHAMVRHVHAARPHSNPATRQSHPVHIQKYFPGLTLVEPFWSEAGSSPSGRLAHAQPR